MGNWTEANSYFHQGARIQAEREAYDFYARREAERQRSPIVGGQLKAEDMPQQEPLMLPAPETKETET